MDFLVRTGGFCTPERHEFILLPDLTGLSSLVELLTTGADAH